MEPWRKPRSLVDLCVQKAIDNLRQVNHVDGIATELLKRILPHCTLAQLKHISENTHTDLSEVTDPLWRRFYRQQFGEDHTNLVIERMKESGQYYTWRELFKVKEKQQRKLEDKMLKKITQKFQAEKVEKQRKQIKLCTKVPPSSKRSFYAGGPSSLSNCSYKSPILKKARMEANSRARLQSAIRKNTFPRSSQQIRTSLSGQPVSTTTIHRPNSTVTITKPIGSNRQIQKSRTKF